MRKADDKHLLVEISLVESKIYHSLENYAKAKVINNFFILEQILKLYKNRLL